LLRGFQAADDLSKGDLLRDVLQHDPDEVYRGLLTVLLRLVVLLYAEDRGLMSEEEVYVRHYSVTELFDQLREDAGRNPDTMDQRFGAWARLLTLFRLVHDGGRHGKMKLPSRDGGLFHPDDYPFLEGRPRGSKRQPGERVRPPLVSDGVIHRVLDRLLVLDGERLAYRALAEEQIGSVYETMIGLRLEVARGRSIAVRTPKAHGAPAAINLDELLSVAPAKRNEWLKERTDQALTGRALKSLSEARTPEDVVAALDRKVAVEATPRIVPPGAMGATTERRRAGLHYTPPELTRPIVERTLQPVLQRFGASPTPEQILSLRVCDVAMGSGAFLVQACRQLGDALVAAWHDHNQVPTDIPPDEDEVLYARRMVARRCLYGVDKNPMAVTLAKMSLWLATLAKEHAFTFLDHALKEGDSLVGLSRQQIAACNWKAVGQMEFVGKLLDERLPAAMEQRRQISQSKEEEPIDELHLKLRDAERTLADVRLVGDLMVAVFFSSEKPKEREARRAVLWPRLQPWLTSGEGGNELRVEVGRLRGGERPLVPFHWEIEFPEVFARDNPGFDAIVGNPPFAGKNTVLAAHPDGYLDWLKMLHEESHGNADQAAHFFRRAFNLLRRGGTFGLIATNTIGQGDTRSTGLRWICKHGGTIYQATKRLKWPGQSAVVVSVVHVVKGDLPGPFDLDGRKVPVITAFLFRAGGHDDPAPLTQNANKSFIGSYVLGMGFTFDDTDKSGVASPLAEMRRLIEKDPRNAERIFPYIGGEEVNDSPTHAHHRYVINFGDMSEEEARRWPDLMAIVEEKVKPQRDKDNRELRKRYWWRFGETTPALFAATRGLDRILVCPIISNKLSVTVRKISDWLDMTSGFC
jgi:hypothetical protein